MKLIEKLMSKFGYVKVEKVEKVDKPEVKLEVPSPFFRRENTVCVRCKVDQKSKWKLSDSGHCNNCYDKKLGYW